MIRYLIPSFLLWGCSAKETAPTYSPIIKNQLARLENACPKTVLPESVPADRKEILLDSIELANNAKYREAALMDFISNPQQSIVVLREYVLDSNVELIDRAIALALFAELPANDSVPAIITILEKSKETDLRAAAAGILGRLGVSTAIPRLTLRLKYETDAWVLLWIEEALAKLNNFSGARFFCEAYDLRPNPSLSENEAIRTDFFQTSRAVLGKAQFKIEQEEIPAICQLLQALDKTWKEQGELANAKTVVDACLEREILQLIHGLAQWQLRDVDDARYQLLHLGKLVVPYLRQALQDENRYVRAHSIELVREMGPPAQEASPELLTLLADPFHKADALESLGAIRAASATPQIARALEEKYPEVRRAAALAAGNLGDDKLIPALKQSMKDFAKDDSFCTAAAGSIAALGDLSGLEILASFLSNPNVDPDEIWRWIARGLEKQKSKGVDIPQFEKNTPAKEKEAAFRSFLEQQSKK